VIDFLRKSNFAKSALIGLLGGVCLFTLAAIIYVRFHYAAVMPRSPEPETGRIFPVKAQFEVVVYVNERELQWRNFVERPTPCLWRQRISRILVGKLSGMVREENGDKLTVSCCSCPATKRAVAQITIFRVVRRTHRYNARGCEVEGEQNDDGSKQTTTAIVVLPPDDKWGQVFTFDVLIAVIRYDRVSPGYGERKAAARFLL
jgi:hypothetical protein